MRLLSQQQIKEEQLRLLQVGGFSLAEYADPNNKTKMFRELSSETCVAGLGRLKVGRVKSAGLSANANLKALACALLHSIYWVEMKADLLDIIKSALYSPDVDLGAVAHHSLPHLANRQMKKLVVEFFYSLMYSQFENKVEAKLCKYPIVMQILVLFFRTVLANLGLPCANDYLLKVSTREAYSLLIDFFDLNCKIQDSLFLFYEDRIFIAEDPQAEVMVGCYLENDTQEVMQPQRREREESSDEEEEFRMSISRERESKERKSGEMHERSIQLRGIVGESLMIDPNTMTPFFNQNTGRDSFKYAHDFSASAERIQQSHKKNSPSNEAMPSTTSIEDKTDSEKNKEEMKPRMGSFGSFVQKALVQQTTCCVGLGENDSPMTMDSHNGNIPEGVEFGERRESEEMRVMKKSKSQHGEKLTKNTKKVEKDSREASLQTEFVTLKGHCACFPFKKSKNLIRSNLYEVNINFVPTPHLRRQNQNQNHSHSSPTIESYGDFYVSSKGISCELYARSPEPSHSHSNSQYQTQSLPQPHSQYEHPQLQHYHPAQHSQHSQGYYPQPNPQSNFRKANHIETSFYSAHPPSRGPNPQNDSLSRRQPSPVSFTNACDRSFSNYGDPRSVKSPRITFNYKNPLKFSTDLLSQPRRK